MTTLPGRADVLLATSLEELSPNYWSFDGSAARCYCQSYFQYPVMMVGLALKWDGDIYCESSHIQLTSHVFPPSEEKDCSIRDDLGEMSSQT